MTSEISDDAVPLATRWTRSWPAIVRGAAGLVALFVVLDLYTRRSSLSSAVLPGATTTLRRTAELFADTEFLRAVLNTLQGAGLGLLVAAVLALPIGVLLGTSQKAYSACSAVIELLRPVPAVAIIPAAILLFGPGTQMKVFLVAFSTFWILLFNTVYGVRDVDPVAKETARVFGTSRTKVLLRVSLPSAAPFIYTGVQIASTAALLITIGSELLAGGSGGVGQWLLTNQNAATKQDYVFGGAFFTALIGLAINLLLQLGERRLFPWSQKFQGDQR